MEYNFEKERREAIVAGERALSSLRRAEQALGSAGNWGVLDLLGGGLISGLMKHDKMRTAQGYIEDAKRDLRSFRRELADVNSICHLDINIGDFLTFADFFFDGLIADWLVQSKIRDARRQVENAIRQTQNILDRLKRM